MPDLSIRVRRALFGLSRREADFATRGFTATAADKRACLESVGRRFIDGYHAWLAEDLDSELAQGDPALCGFAVEGAAMACTLLDYLDYLTPWRRDRWTRLLADRPEHIYMAHIGAGWATARRHGSLRRAIGRRDPLLGWLVADGWGFHQTYFHPARFAPQRRADLWSGVGLAATYAGGCEAADLEALVTLAGRCRAPLAQGAAFAATARAVAGNLTPSVDRAAHALSGLSGVELWKLSKTCEPRAPHGRFGDDYEHWRARLRAALGSSEAA